MHKVERQIWLSKFCQAEFTWSTMHRCTDLLAARGVVAPQVHHTVLPRKIEVGRLSAAKPARKRSHSPKM